MTDTIRTHVADATDARTCDKHGAYTATRWRLDPMPALKKGGKELPPFIQPFWSQCPICDAERQREADQHDEAIRGGLSIKARLRAAVMASSGIPPRHAESTVWNWQHAMDQQRTIWGWVRDYCNAFELAIANGRSAVLTGAPGTGKTHLAIGILRHFLEKGGTGRYATVMAMLGRIKDTYNKNADETEAKVVAHFSGVDLLVIDEVGRSLDTQYEVAQFFRILDQRHQNMKPTVLVSNLVPKDLRAFLTESVVDRLMEGGGKVLVFDWPSLRSKRMPKAEA